MPPVILVELCIIAGFAVLVVVAWSLQHDAIRPPIVRLWSLGALAMGAGTTLLILRPYLPGLLTYTVTNLLWFSAPLLRAMALRELCGRARRPMAHAVLLLTCTAIYHHLWQNESAVVRQVFSISVSTTGFAYVGLWAWRAWRHQPSLGAALMAWCEGLGLLLQIGQVAVALSGAWSSHLPIDSLTYHLFFAGQTFTFFLAYIGFFGMVLNMVARERMLARERELLEAGSRQEAERSVLRLTELLNQRDALAAEREQLLRIMAHEVRQPLHNASGVLQAIRWHAHEVDTLDIDDLVQRAYRAELVLTEVRDVLDNVLQATVLLGSQEPLTLQRTELDFLLELALMDLPLEQRQSVQVVRDADDRAVQLEPNLMRLALRNLLRNAFRHGGASPSVSIVVDTGSWHGAGWLSIAVNDNGPGMSPDQIAAFEQAPPGDGLPLHAPPQRTLGLSITRRVAQRHGGRLVLRNLAPNGLSASLEIPIAAAAAAEGAAPAAQARSKGSRNT